MAEILSAEKRAELRSWAADGFECEAGDVVDLCDEVDRLAARLAEVEQALNDLLDYTLDYVYDPLAKPILDCWAVLDKGEQT